MGRPYPANIDDLGRMPTSALGPEAMHNHDHPSAVSWGAIFAGAAAAASLSLILLMLGVGLGLSSVSPWSPEGVSAGKLGASTIAWVTFTQLAASGMGGYLAGRLRNRWVAVHGDEVHFRDTAHGFLAWAIASLATAALLSSAIGSIVGVGTQTVASPAAITADVAAEPDNSMQSAYFVDSLFRRDSPAAAGAAETTSAPAASAEAGRIFLTNIDSAALPPDDLRHLGQLVSERTGLSQADAQKRVSDTYSRLHARLTEAKAVALQMAEQARKAAAAATLWLFIALLAGAFFASLCASYGGEQRDR